MSAGTLGPFRPQHSKPPGRDADNVPVVIGKHREIPLQQTLKAHLRARRAGLPRTPIITLVQAKEKKERTGSADSNRSDAKAENTGSSSMRPSKRTRTLAESVTFAGRNLKASHEITLTT